MAAIDFPTPSGVGATFAAGNGVVYTWTGTLWLASGASAGGDFYARKTTSTALTASFATLVPDTVITGNSGGWYSTSTGRYSPPAGRYCITGAFIGGGPASVHCDICIRKNGTNVQQHTSTTPSTGTFATPYVSGVYDTNGTDWFDLQGAVSGGGGTGYPIEFYAYPISGIKGPPGDPGQPGFRLLQRTVVSSAVADVSIQGIASDINDIEFRFDLTPVTADDTLRLQFYNAAGTLITTGYVWSAMLMQHGMATGAAPQMYASGPSGITTSYLLHFYGAGNGVGNVAGGGIRGDGSVYNIRDATRVKTANCRTAHFNNALTGQNGGISNGTWNSLGAISGVRLFFGSGNIASGAFSVWGSTS